MADEKKTEAVETAEKVKKAPATGKVAEILEAVKGMTVMELADLVKAMEDEFGVTAAAPVMAVAPGAAAVAEEVEEQTEFDAMLTQVGSQKIQVIKVVRAITGLGLKEAKDLVESAPAAIKEGVSKEECEDVKKQLEEVGATVEFK